MRKSEFWFDSVHLVEGGRCHEILKTSAQNISPYDGLYIGVRLRSPWSMVNVFFLQK